MSTFRQIVGWFGRVVNADDFEKIWLAIENRLDRLVLDMLDNESDDPVLIDPPTLSFLTSTVTVGELRGWSLGQPVYYEGAGKAVPIDEATHGSLLGSVLPAFGFSRMVILLVRYTTVEHDPVTDDNGNPSYNELHHGIEFRAIMGNQYVPPADGTPPDLDDEIRAGSIPIAAVRVYDDGAVNWEHQPCYRQNRFRDQRTEDQLLAMLSPGSCWLRPTPTGSQTWKLPLTYEDIAGTLYLDIPQTSVWAARIGDRLVTSDMDLLSDTLQVPVPTGTYYVYLELETASGHWYPKLSTSLTLDDDADETKILIGKSVYNGVDPPTITQYERSPLTPAIGTMECAAPVVSNPIAAFQTILPWTLVTAPTNYEITPNAGAGTHTVTRRGLYQAECDLSFSGNAAGTVDFTFAFGINGTDQGERCKEDNVLDTEQRSIHFHQLLALEAGDAVSVMDKSSVPSSYTNRLGYFSLRRVR